MPRRTPSTFRLQQTRTRQTVQRMWRRRPLWPNLPTHRLLQSQRKPQPMPSPQRHKPLKWLHRLRPPRLSNRHALWWLCAVMTDRAKNAPSWRLPAAVASLAIAAKAVVMDGLRTAAIALADPVTVREIALVTAASVWTAAPV